MPPASSLRLKWFIIDDDHDGIRTVLKMLSGCRILTPSENGSKLLANAWRCEDRGAHASCCSFVITTLDWCLCATAVHNSPTGLPGTRVVAGGCSVRERLCKTQKKSFTAVSTAYITLHCWVSYHQRTIPSCAVPKQHNEQGGGARESKIELKRNENGQTRHI